MTETTDIATLMRDMRDLADRIVECQGENSNGEEIIHLYDQSDTTFKAQNILLVLNAFEAERQRADELQSTVSRLALESNRLFDDRRRINKNWTEAETDNALLRDELAALKGDQVPVGEIVAWAGTNRDMGITREVDFRFLRFDVLPGTKLYAVEPAPATIQLCDPPAGVVMRPRFEKPEDCKCSSIDYCESCLEAMMSKPAPAAKSDLLTHAEVLAVEARALASRIQAGE